MKYMGSKARIAKHILPIVLADRDKGQYYVEPFVGGANMIDKVAGDRIGADSNRYLIALWQALQSGWVPPKITKDEYITIRDNKDNHEDHLVGWVGIGCSYSGKWFGGYAGEVQTKGGFRDYQSEAIRNVLKQVPKLDTVEFISSHYSDLIIPENSIIYCDPPYEGTTKYKDDFDHTAFWNWCRGLVEAGSKVFVSEYNAAADFICVWEQHVVSSLSANGKHGSSKSSVERLFVHKTQV
jgi:DNA adenine methylase